MNEEDPEEEEEEEEEENLFRSNEEDPERDRADEHGLDTVCHPLFTTGFRKQLSSAWVDRDMRVGIYCHLHTEHEMTSACYAQHMTLHPRTRKANLSQLFPPLWPWSLLPAA